MAEFEEPILKCDLTKLEENTIAWFMSGLRPSIAHTIQLQSYWNFQDVVNLAVKAGRQQGMLKKLFIKSTPRQVNDIAKSS